MIMLSQGKTTTHINLITVNSKRIVQTLTLVTISHYYQRESPSLFQKEAF